MTRTEKIEKLLELSRKEDELINECLELREIIKTDKSPFAPTFLKERQEEAEQLKADAIDAGVKLLQAIRFYAIELGAFPEYKSK